MMEMMSISPMELEGPDVVGLEAPDRVRYVAG